MKGEAPVDLAAILKAEMGQAGLPGWQWSDEPMGWMWMRHTRWWLGHAGRMSSCREPRAWWRIWVWDGAEYQPFTRGAGSGEAPCMLDAMKAAEKFAAGIAGIRTLQIP